MFWSYTPGLCPAKDHTDWEKLNGFKLGKSGLVSVGGGDPPVDNAYAGSEGRCSYDR